MIALFLATLLAGCGAAAVDRGETESAPASATAADVTPTPGEEVAAEPSIGTATGRSNLTSASVCVPAGPPGCFGYHSWDDGTFALAGPVREARLIAWWNASTATTDELSVSIVGEIDVSAAGTSPLELRPGDLAAGEYRVAVRMAAPGGVVKDQAVDWTLTFEPAE